MNTNKLVNILAQQPLFRIEPNSIDSASPTHGEYDTYTDSDSKLNAIKVRAHYYLTIFDPIISSLFLYATPIFVKVIAKQPLFRILPNSIDSAS